MNKINKLKTFIKALDGEVSNLMNDLHTGKEYDENKYDLKISVGSHELRLDLNADTFCNLSDYLLEELKDEVKTSIPMFDFNREIKFKYVGHIITDPTHSIKGTATVDPIEYYGKEFLLSDWTNIDGAVGSTGESD